ncbi:VOC family protein [Natronorubrum tibetense]|uniref:Glyoxalase/bleomycin resistance protein/dioxygenase n=1 Tax=Natronorubrum tibetense GA33 TaxID=1114856 RepID=L9VZM7_9EURY|nr:VOC family protein [Natronorubrum tibetense]ELY41498.1 glyoxalase/bleomycin resistance protein/dioxygenase [Natronorubrum tibetense GA33]
MSDSSGLLPDSSRIGRTALTVGDESAVIDFYRNTVGLEQLTREASTTTLGVDRRSLLEVRYDAAARPRPEDATGLFHNAFRVPSRAALGDALARVRDGWVLTGASDHGVSEALYCTDPEGNGVELYRDRPQEDWPRDDDGSLEIGSWPLDLVDLAAAASDGPVSTVPAETSLGHVHLEVSSLEDACEFYVDTLGFDVMDTSPSAVFLAVGGYHHHLGLNTWHRRSVPPTADHCGLAWFELVVPSSDALETVRRRLEDCGVPVTDRDEGFEIADPDGSTIRLVAES